MLSNLSFCGGSWIILQFSISWCSEHFLNFLIVVKITVAFPLSAFNMWMELSCLNSLSALSSFVLRLFLGNLARRKTSVICIRA